jgi:hypothetical protein
VRKTLEERFWSKVTISSAGVCWPWTRSRNGGYGQFRVAMGASPQRASRVAWALTYGDPGVLCVLHHCDNPPCCNPRHLFLGTRADNNEDCVRKGRRPAGSADHMRSVGRRLTDDQLREIHRRDRVGESARSIARSLGVAHTTVSRLLNGTHWVGYDLDPEPRCAPRL